jgi:hypothetical protein
MSNYMRLPVKDDAPRQHMREELERLSRELHGLVDDPGLALGRITAVDALRMRSVAAWMARAADCISMRSEVPHLTEETQ